MSGASNGSDNRVELPLIFGGEAGGVGGMDRGIDFRGERGTSGGKVQAWSSFDGSVVTSELADSEAVSIRGGGILIFCDDTTVAGTGEGMPG